MLNPPDKLSKEERLAAKLRENLRRRKAQARALGTPGADTTVTTTENDSDALSNAAPES